MTDIDDPPESIGNDEREFLFLDTKGMTKMEKIKLADILDIKTFTEGDEIETDDKPKHVE